MFSRVAFALIKISQMLLSHVPMWPTCVFPCLPLWLHVLPVPDPRSGFALTCICVTTQHPPCGSGHRHHSPPSSPPLSHHYLRDLPGYPHHQPRAPRPMESLIASRSVRSSFVAAAGTRGYPHRPSRVAILAGARACPLRAGHRVRIYCCPRICFSPCWRLNADSFVSQVNSGV